MSESVEFEGDVCLSSSQLFVFQLWEAKKEVLFDCLFNGVLIGTI